MNITVMRRADAIKYCHQHHDTPAVMISISTPFMPYTGAPFCSPENKLKTIARLWFEDADSGPDIMTQDDAKLVKSLVNRFPDTDFIVHCDAGQSRSAGVAAAIMKFKTGSDMPIFKNPKYQPNMHCYRMTLNALHED